MVWYHISHADVISSFSGIRIILTYYHRTSSCRLIVLYHTILWCIFVLCFISFHYNTSIVLLLPVVAHLRNEVSYEEYHSIFGLCR